MKSIVSEKNTAAVKDKNLKGKVKDQDNIQARIISQKSKNYKINYIFPEWIPFTGSHGGLSAVEVLGDVLRGI